MAKVIHDLKPPHDGESWFGYFFRHSGADTRLLYCAVYGCPRPPTSAAPMNDDVSGRRFVAPLCAEHAGSSEELVIYRFALTADLK
ncbi:MAG: hypothetical protein PHI85_01410 [Victivallaceae bacterium]|nr:hypothetical protein [Victivallaceae bacterium]